MYQKIIIIGAPRSGTNMLRNTLVKLNGVATWPCDEINYIWRYGNAKSMTDEFTPAMASEKTTAYIRQSFDEVSAKTGAETIVEKTCANSLRVSFVDSVVPDAKYIFIVRDGLDAIASASLRWRAKLDLPYLLKKLRYVPLSDIPFYGMEYMKARLHMNSTDEGRQSYWGPKIKALEDQIDELSLLKICAMQWRECVDKAATELAELSDDRVRTIRYEEFVTHPGKLLNELGLFMDIDLTQAKINDAVKDISASSIGKGKLLIDELSVSEIAPIIKNTMLSHGYAI